MYRMNRTMLVLIVLVVAMLHLSPSCLGQVECDSNGDIRIADPKETSNTINFFTYEYISGPLDICYSGSFIGVCANVINDTAIRNAACRALGYDGKVNHPL